MKRMMLCAILGMGWLTPQGWALSTSFGEFAVGPFSELSGAGGRWRVTQGKAEINSSFSRSKTNSLRLFGGEDTTVELTPVDPAGVRLSFYAERWTASQPFKFRVEGWQAGGWRELYRGDETIKVGARFLSRVVIELPQPGPEKYRFVCSAPPQGGILIDDLALTTPEPMRLTAVTTDQWVVPALIGKEGNPVLQVKIETVGELQPLRVKSLTITMAGTTDLNDIESVCGYYTGTDGAFSLKQPLGASQAPDRKLSLACAQELTEGMNFFWVSYRLKDRASLGHRVDGGCEQVELVGGESRRPEPVSPPGSQRIGFALRQAGQDGSHTYRIPGLITTNQGTLIAVYDIRWENSGDLPGNIDIGMSRSIDGGQRWEPMRTIMDMGDSKEFLGDGIGDPAVLVDRTTGTIWVAALWSHGNRGWNGSGPGLTPEETGQLMLTRSDDDGLTWSAPENITSQVKQPQWCLLLQGPGKGISMRDGTLVFAAQFQDTLENRRAPWATVITSSDHGQNWRIGVGAQSDTTEAQVVELDDGTLMLNIRDNRNGSDKGETNGRSVFVSGDLGQSWCEHPSSRGGLPESVCMASLIRFCSKKDGCAESVLLFSNPNTKTGRHHLTIKASLDEGQTWPQACQLLLNERPGYGYSCLTVVDEDHVGILYEEVGELTFEKVPMTEILGSIRYKQ